MMHANGSAGACSARSVIREALDSYYQDAERVVCDTGRYRCRYYVWGRGPTLIFVPGLCDDGLSFVLPISRLKDHFRCIAYDLPGGHDDGASLRRYRHTDYIADLFTLLDPLQLRKAYLFGSSFGSTVTLGAMALQPDRFPRAILQGGFACRPLTPAEEMLAAFGRYWPGNMAHLPFRTVVLKNSHDASFLGREPEFWNFYISRSGSPPMAAVAQRALLMHRLDM